MPFSAGNGFWVLENRPKLVWRSCLKALFEINLLKKVKLINTVFVEKLQNCVNSVYRRIAKTHDRKFDNEATLKYVWVVLIY